MNNYRFILDYLCFVVLLHSNLANAQELFIPELLKSYPNQPCLYLERKEKAVIQVLKNKLNVTKEHHERFLILKGNYNNIRKKRIHSSPFVKIEDLKVFIHVYNGKTHKRRKVEDIQLNSENFGDGSFYDSDMYYTISFPEAKEGDIIEISYRENYLEPRFFGSFFLSNYYPALSTQFSVTYPTALVKLRVKEYNAQFVSLKRQQQELKGKTTLSWTADTVSAVIQEDFDPGFRRKTAYLLCNIESYTGTDSTVNIGGNIPNLYAWYVDLVKNVDLTEDLELKHLTDSLIKNEPDDLSKLRKIFYWVQNKISYIAYEDGMNGYIPRDAGVVCKQRFGDCKDMANVIVRMAKHAGLPVYRAWIGTNEIPYQFSEFAAPFSANHMIAAYLGPKDTLFLDATGKDHPFGLPTAMIQGKEAIIGITPNSFLVKKVPVTISKISEEHDSVVVSIKPHNRLEGIGYYTASGYERLEVLSGLTKNSYDVQKEYLRRLFEKGNNKFRLDTFYIIQNEVEKPLILYYTFSIQDYLTQYGNNAYVNLNFNKDFFDKISTSNRKHEINFSHRYLNKLTVRLNLSADQIPEVVPGDVKAGNTLIEFGCHYDSKPDHIVFENFISIDETEIPTARFNELNEIVSKYKNSKSHLVGVAIKQ